MQYVVAFAIIFVLLSGLALVLRRLTGARAASSAVVPEGNRNRQPRLGIIDIYELDRQRRLILLRRDNSEHLLLIGGPNDVVVETNIGRAQGARTGPATSEAEPERSEALAERYAEPPASVRPVIEAPRPPLAAVAPLATQSAPADAPVEVPVPTPVRAEPASPSPVEPMRRPQRPAPAPAPAPASRSAGVGGRANEIARPPEGARAPAPAAEAGRPRIEPSTRVGRPADPAVLSDMARQLEEALRRPRPTEAGSDAAMALTALPEPFPVPPMRPVEVLAPQHAGIVAPVGPPPQQPPPEPEARTAEIAAAPAEHLPEAPPRPPEPAPVVAPTPAPAPSPQPAPPTSPVALPAAPSPAATAPAAAPSAGLAPSDAVRDPFSVEEIEAEFARLLGRPFDKAERG